MSPSKVIDELLNNFYENQYDEKNWFYPSYDRITETDYEGNKYHTFYIC